MRHGDEFPRLSVRVVTIAMLMGLGAGDGQRICVHGFFTEALYRADDLKFW